MTRDSRIEEQLRHFYDNVPNVNDALPLKDYLLKHEDSRMAWYLLGKQYESQGREAKAAYCFGQAGDIYEAFEAKPAPKLPDERCEKERSKKRSGRLFKRSVLLLTVLGLAVLSFQQFEPVDPRGAQVTGDEIHSTGKAASIQRTSAGQLLSPESTITAPGLIAGISGPDHAGKKQIGELLTGGKFSQSILLVRSVQLGKWTDWVKSGKPVADVITDGNAGIGNILWYDPKWCVCIPHHSRTAQKTIEGWKPLQEEKLLLRSAMAGYRQRTGKWPDKPESLAGAYPDNTMAGWTDDMTAWFYELKGALNNKMDGKIPKTGGWPQKSGSQAGNGNPGGLFSAIAEQRLAIMVDKSNHRLAIVSGNVLIRNYKVGLGGSKTPEGKFVITEKVRNPNGRTEGPFGSRGMTLSNSRYAIHGTDEPESMGKDESLGCIRMLKEDLEELYDLIPIGTTVTIAKGGLPDELRTPPERFRLPGTQVETNPQKVYDWLT